MEIQIVSGFFGSGKTTFILNFLKKTEKKVAVLVNEFGELSIDGDIIKTENDLEVVELPSGCICCSLRGSLPVTIDQIYESYMPDILLIEPSGIATPSNILVAIRDAKNSGDFTVKPVIGIVDASNFMDYLVEFGNFFRDQIETSDVILINKSDLVGEMTLDMITAKINEINPTAVIIRTSYCKFIPDVEGKRDILDVESKDYILDLVSVSITPGKAISEKGLKEFVQDLAEGKYGVVIRAKGFIMSDVYYTFQVSGGNWTFEKCKKQVSPKAVIIGTDLKVKAITKFFEG